MIKHDNISKKKLWGFAKFNTTKNDGDKIEIYEEIFNLSFDISQLNDRLNGIIEMDEKIKITQIIKSKKKEIKILEEKIIKFNIIDTE